MSPYESGRSIISGLQWILLILLVVAVLAWLWQQTQKNRKRQDPNRKRVRPQPTPEEEKHGEVSPCPTCGDRSIIFESMIESREEEGEGDGEMFGVAKCQKCGATRSLV